MPGVTIEQLIEKWRQQIAPEIPMPVLLGFMRFESGWEFSTTLPTARQKTILPTHSLRSMNSGFFRPQPDFTASARAATPGNSPPGTEFRAIPQPGLASANKSAQIRKIRSHPHNAGSSRFARSQKTAPTPFALRTRNCFPRLGAIRYLRAAVLLPFARGGGFTRAFLSAFRKDLAKLREEDRWTLLAREASPGFAEARGCWTEPT